MPPQPPSDDPQLPKLRRFRLDADGSKVAREIPAEPAATPDAVNSETAADDAPIGRLSEEVFDPDRLLDETVVMPPAPAPTSTQRESDLKASSRGQRPSNIDAHVSAASPSPASQLPVTTGSFAAPVRSVGDAAPVTGSVRSRLPLLLGAIAGVLVIALITWLVVGSGGNDNPKNNGNETAAEPSGGRSDETSEVTTWASGVCTAMAKFGVDAMPIRAASSQAVNSPSLEKLNDLQRQGSQLLTGLAGSLQSVGPPSSNKELAAFHVELLTVTNQAANLTNTTSGGAIGSPSDRAAALTSALDAPVSLFIDGVESLPKEVGDEIAAAPACKGTL